MDRTYSLTELLKRIDLEDLKDLNSEINWDFPLEHLLSLSERRNQEVNFLNNSDLFPGTLAVYIRNRYEHRTEGGSGSDQEHPLGTLLGSLEIAKLTEVYGKPFPIKEEIHQFADKDEACPDLEWLETRNKKLNIRCSTRYAQTIISPRNLGKYLLGYFTASGSIINVRFDLFEDARYCPREHFVISSTLFGKPDIVWSETILLPVKEAVLHIARKKGMSKADLDKPFYSHLPQTSRL